jgi:hypothetical protein
MVLQTVRQERKLSKNAEEQGGRMVRRGLRGVAVIVLLLAAFAVRHPAVLHANPNNSCYCNQYYPSLYAYPSTLISQGGWTYTGPFTLYGGAGVCQAYCQSWFIDNADAMCDGQGWESEGQGFVTGSWDYGYFDFDGNYTGSGASQQYDCGDI